MNRDRVGEAVVAFASAWGISAAIDDSDDDDDGGSGAEEVGGGGRGLGTSWYISDAASRKVGLPVECPFVVERV